MIRIERNNLLVGYLVHRLCFDLLRGRSGRASCGFGIAWSVEDFILAREGGKGASDVFGADLGRHLDFALGLLLGINHLEYGTLFGGSLQHTFIPGHNYVAVVAEACSKSA